MSFGLFGTVSVARNEVLPTGGEVTYWRAQPGYARRRSRFQAGRAVAPEPRRCANRIRWLENERGRTILERSRETTAGPMPQSDFVSAINPALKKMLDLLLSLSIDAMSWKGFWATHVRSVVARPGYRAIGWYREATEDVIMHQLEMRKDRTIVTREAKSAHSMNDLFVNLI